MRPFRLALAVPCSLAWIVAASPSAADADAVNAYLAETARAIDTADGTWIDPYVGDHRVVLVGEEVHGIAEHMSLKGEIAARLITHHGFTHVLIEDDVFKADAMNDSLRAGALPPVAPLFGPFFWCWNVTEMHAVYDALASLAPVRRFSASTCSRPSVRSDR